MSSNFDRFAKDVRESLSPQALELLEAMSDSFSVGVQIHQMRKQVGLTQAQLEERSGVPQAEISRIENGAVTPSFTRTRKLVTAMGGSTPILTPSATSALMTMKAHEAYRDR